MASRGIRQQRVDLISGASQEVVITKSVFLT